jgi:DMSO reductase anchor subunit
VIDLLLVLGVLAAFFHLGRPIKARHTMANLKKSWLSREMLLGISFGLTLFALTVFQWLNADFSMLQNVLLLLGIIFGIGLLYGMSRIYMLRTVPTWNNLAIPLSFFSSTFLLGSILIGLVIAFLNSSHPVVSDLSQGMEKPLLWIEIGSLGLTFVQVLLSYVMLKGFHAQIHPMDNSFGISWIKYRLTFMLRLGLGLIGIALYINFMDQIIGNFQSEGPWEYLLLASFFLVLLSECLGRILFYASYKSAGL